LKRINDELHLKLKQLTNDHDNSKANNSNLESKLESLNDEYTLLKEDYEEISMRASKQKMEVLQLREQQQTIKVVKEEVKEENSNSNSTTGAEKKPSVDSQTLGKEEKDALELNAQINDLKELVELKVNTIKELNLKCESLRNVTQKSDPKLSVEYKELTDVLNRVYSEKLATQKHVVELQHQILRQDKPTNLIKNVLDTDKIQANDKKKNEEFERILREEKQKKIPIWLVKRKN